MLLRFRPFQRMPGRLAFFLLSCFLASRYLWWRTCETLVFTGPFDFVGMALLYAAEVYAITLHFLGMLVNLSPLTTESVALPANRADWPTVDVLIPTYNEPVDVVRVTVLAATQIDYPAEKLRIHILDDGGTLARRYDPAHAEAAWERRYALLRLARETGANYLTRETNRGAKAGNLNHALQHTRGDLVLFLDCDHVPTKDILTMTAGHFVADPRLFLVQTPHFFVNPAPVDRSVSSHGAVPDEGDMFYRVIHRGLNFWNASYFCGSAALMRKSALDEVGGISGATITEDAETSLALHSRGYNSVYIRRPLVCGLSPESFDDYMLQRSRWAQGMVQLFLLNNPLFDRGLSFAQRMCYFNSCFFWFFSLARIVYFCAPAAFLVFGLNIYHASSDQVLAYALPYVLSTFVVMHFLYSAARQPFFSEIYESVQSLTLLPAVLKAIVNPHAPTFKVTPKERRLGAGFLNPLALPFYAIICVNVAALGLGAVKWWQYPTYRDILAITIAWSVYNLYVGLVSLGAFWEQSQVRRHHRIQARGAVTLTIERSGEVIAAKLSDISLGGAGVTFPLDTPLRDHDIVEVQARDSYGALHSIRGSAQSLRLGKTHATCGVEFLAGEGADRRIVGFVFGDSARWVELWGDRARYGGTLPLLFVLLALGSRAFLQVTLSLILKPLRAALAGALRAGIPRLRRKAVA
jgi:cellulose synthase (UDP-forming)